MTMRILIAYDGSSGADTALFDLQRAGLPREAEALVISVADVWTFPSSSDDPRGSRAEKPDVIDLNKARLQAVTSRQHFKVLYEARCSVRVARGHADEGKSPVRILIGVDGSPYAEAAVSEVAARNWSPGSESRVIAVHSPLTLLATHHFVHPVSVAAGDYMDESALAQKIVDAAAEKLRAEGLTASPIVKEGNPKQVLVDEAKEWGASCIFVGAKGLRSWKARASACASSADHSMALVRRSGRSRTCSTRTSRSRRAHARAHASLCRPSTKSAPPTSSKGQ